MMMETPSISASAYTGSTYGLGDLTGSAQQVQGLLVGNPFFLGAQNAAQADTFRTLKGAAAIQGAAAPQRKMKPQQLQQLQESPVTRRLIQVFIADPDEKVPLDKSLIYTGSQKLTDLNDQELFFEIEIKALLDQHNATRATIIDKEVKDRTEYLEPVKIREA